MQNFEQLGSFYLGRRYDAEARRILDDLVLYDAKDLTTHAVCVGMTGSGKTGLCVGLLEEAAIDGVPALIIDPKGDLGNLALTFPALSAGEFRPWIDESEAARKGMSVDAYATHMSQLWRKGLADWGQGPERIERLRQASEVSIYTPGSRSGLPLRVLGSFGAPGPALLAEPDALQERVSSSVSSLLALIGVDADPIQSREHILLANIVDRAWSEGRDLDLARLIRDVQAPPFDRIGVMDLEAIFPGRERAQLAMQLNNLLASPSFEAWMEGEPLDVQRLLYTPDGKPRSTILSIAHLGDAERMFFVTRLLGEVVAWMRQQPGTSSLRALLYMDEVFGFLPPVANPPSKLPFLTLLKQARAFGLGVVLATQNPVDLDYKALSNAGTWFLGRLQTERDKARVLDGLEGAAQTTGASFDRREFDRMLSGLSSRVFLLNNVHEDGPVLFHTRWAMSYLRGPLTRTHIATLMEPRKAAGAGVATAPSTRTAAVGAAAMSTAAVRAAAMSTAAVSATDRPGMPDRPIVPDGIVERFAIPSGRRTSTGLVYRPSLLGVASLHHVSARAGVDSWSRVVGVSELAGEVPANVWDAAAWWQAAPDTDTEPEANAHFVQPVRGALRATSYRKWTKQLATHIYRNRALTLWKHKALKRTSDPGELEADFRVRLGQLARERRDIEIEKVRTKYGTKIARLEERLRKAEARVEREKDQYQSQKLQAMISIGATVLGGLLGRKRVSATSVGRATTAARGVGRAARERGDISRAAESAEALAAQIGELEADVTEALDRVREAWEDTGFELAEVVVRPRKADTAVEELVLLWLPFVQAANGQLEPASEPAHA